MKNVLGNYEWDGNGYRVYTMRGWIHVDNRKELEEELDEIKSILRKEEG